MNSLGSLSVTIRPAYPDDSPALWRLAALDSASVPPAPLLLAEVDGQLRVAVSESDLGAIADPFFRTADIVEMLRGHIRRTGYAARGRSAKLHRLRDGAAPTSWATRARSSATAS